MSNLIKRQGDRGNHAVSRSDPGDRHPRNPLGELREVNNNIVNEKKLPVLAASFCKSLYQVRYTNPACRRQHRL